jgi:hypothetical protein
MFSVGATTWPLPAGWLHRKRVRESNPDLLLPVALGIRKPVVAAWFLSVGFLKGTQTDVLIPGGGVIGLACALVLLSIATGHGMLGVSPSAITGKLVADLLNGRTPGVEFAPMSPLHFQQ